MEAIINGLVNVYGMSAKDINGCYCFSFAEDLGVILDAEGLESEMVNNEQFFTINKQDVVVAWDEEEFDKYNLSIPKYNVKDLDFYHVFTYHNNLFFDAECTSGVKHWIDLPFFKRTIENIK